MARKYERPDGQRPAPLRSIEKTLDIDGHLFDLLVCGHYVSRDDMSGRKRRRCERCKWDAIDEGQRLRIVFGWGSFR